jgi:hypothetical protein
MAIELNHTIIAAKDAKASAIFLSELFNLASPKSFGPFILLKQPMRLV